MLRISALFTLMLCMCYVMIAHAQQSNCPIIPQPAKSSAGNGEFVLSTYTPITYSDLSLQPVAYYFQQAILQSKNIPLQVASNPTGAHISLELKKLANKDVSAYSVVMQPNKIVIQANTPNGIFYGLVSLLQLSRIQAAKNNTVALPCWNIDDAPLLGWRGFMLDEARHFFGKEKVKSLLDWMAFYKLNTFHWHLTDEQGWRFEVKQYPKLALIGGVGDFTNAIAPAKYYTQADIKEIVQYAAERFITVVPEIDMPGHATAANKAYPQYSGGGSKAHPMFTFNPAKEETYDYLTNILREANTLFPSRMLHIGGDEVSYGNEEWPKDPAIQQLMQRKQLKDLKAVENYFMQRMADTIMSLQAKVLAWDEMAEADLPREKTIIYWWRHDKPQQLELALQKGYSTVICPRLPLYFDFVQDSTHRHGRKWNKRYNPLEEVYQFSPLSLAKPNQQYLIKGVQANLWTETVSNNERLDYLLFPRICAFAEMSWTPPSQKDYPAFLQKLERQFPLFDEANIYYYNPTTPTLHSEPIPKKRTVSDYKD
ncbi:hexosaminidase [Chitinophaga skermanii]|uniref:beta-N-acetylhexosaminidase n=1 Tax=Chitinophaga skermanii TaxID=331697 RepID=A0A327QDK3_9BACT|nr:beta-N-acetylhexosaminidase [Chitinophaga skermanii]RAJ02391.1 hexosaminidase [Chitinophaga skermanii]